MRPLREYFSLSFGSTTLVVALAIGTMLVITLLLPGDEERAATMIRDGQRTQARDLIEGLRAEGKAGPADVFTLAQLYLDAGSPDQATAVLEEFLARDPRANWATDQLLAIYRNTGDLEAELSVLRRQFETAPRTENYRRLLGIYRLKGDDQSEQALIARALDLRLASADDVARLAALEAADGQYEEAARQLLSAENAFAEVDIAPRLLLIRLLVDLKRFDEATNLADGWANRWPNNASYQQLKADVPGLIYPS